MAKQKQDEGRLSELAVVAFNWRKNGEKNNQDFK